MERVYPVPSFFTVTFTPGTTAPVLSVTEPRMVAVILWVGVFGFVFMLDRKTAALERRVAQRERQ